MKLIIFLLVITFTSILKAQIGVGTTSPHESAILEVQSSDKGFLLPRLSIANRNSIKAPTNGLMIYCKNCCTEGTISVYNGSSWDNLPNCSITEDDDFDGVPRPHDIDWDNDGIINSLEIHTIDSTTLLTENMFHLENITNGKPETFTIEAETVSHEFDLAMFDTQLNSAILFHSTFRSFNFTIFQNIDPDEGILTSTGSAPSTTNIISNPDQLNIHGLSRFKIEISVDGSFTTWGTLNINSTTYSQLFLSNGDNFLPVHLNNGYVAAINRKRYDEDIPFKVSFQHTYTDMDNDGIINALDLDSDGDGCSDAYEAGLTTNTNPNFNFSDQEAGNNGLADILEDTPDSGVTSPSPNMNFLYLSSIATCTP